MGNNIVFKVLADTKEFQSKFKALNQTAGKVTRNATIAFAAFGGAIALVTKLAKEQQKVMNQTRAVIKSTGGVARFTAEQVFKLGKEMQDITTFGDEVVISATNMLLTFKEIGAETMPRATKAVLDMSVAMDQGLKESAIQLGKALNDPILGLTAMRRVGIQFTKAQEDQIRTLTKAGNIMKAQSLILGELESQFGGSAEAARKGLGAINAFKNSLGDLGENIALVIAPAIERITNAMTNFVDVIKENKTIVSFIATILMLGAAISGLLVIVAGVVFAITTIGPAIATAITLFVLSIGAGISVMGLFKDSVSEVDDAINGEEGLFPKGVENSDSFVGSLANIREEMKVLKGEAFLLGNAITAGLSGQGGGGGFGGDIGTINVKGGEAEQPAFIKGFSSGLDEIKEKIPSLTEAFSKMTVGLHKGMSTAFSDIILGAKTAKEAFGDLGKAMLKALVNFITEWLTFQILSKGLALVGLAFSKTLAAATALAWAPAAAMRSLATAGTNSISATAGIASTVGAALSFAVPKFATGSSGIKDDTIGMFNKREIVVPSSFADGIRSGDLSLSGAGGGGGVVVDLSGAVINGITDELVEEMFTKASENISNGTLAFAGGA